MDGIDARFFRYAFLFSLLLHAAFLANLSYVQRIYFQKSLQNVEVTYVRAKTHSPKAKSVFKKEIDSKPYVDQNTQFLFKKTPTPPPYAPQASQPLREITSVEKTPTEINTASLKHTISIPALTSEKISNPKYISYYETVRDKIKGRAYANIDYSRSDRGEVYLTFVTDSKGNLKQVQVIDDRSKASDYLKEVSLKSIQEAGPFPEFTKGLNFPELSFNIVISFGMEE